MDCSDAKLRIEPYATGNLASPDREDFEAHLTDCEGCRLELDLLRAGVGKARAGAEPTSDPPSAPEFMRSGDLGYTPGAAFGASSSLDEVSFADVASQLSDEPGAGLADLEHSASPLAPPPAKPPSMPPPDPAPNAPESGVGSFPGATNHDYSLDSLLADAAPSPPEGSQEPPPPVDPLARVFPPGDAEPPTAAAPPKSATPPAVGTSWEFEPAEAGGAAAPPEGSLFFAEETLARARDAGRRRKSGGAKLALWVAGSVAGVVLLLFAGWIAWHPHPSGESEPVANQQSVAPERPAPPTPPARDDGGRASPPSAAAPAPTAFGAPVEQPARAEQEVSPSAAPPPGEPAIVSASTVAPRATLPESPRRATAAPPARPRAARTVSPSPSAEAPRATAAGDAQETRGAARRPSPASSAATPPSVGSSKPPVKPERAPDETRTPPAPAASSGSGQPATSAPATEARVGAAEPSEPARRQPEAPATGQTPSTGSPAITPAAPSGAAPPSPPPAEASPPGSAPGTSAPVGHEEEPAPPPSRPIDRLHLAMVAAEQRGDLNALRDMRDAWKNFLQKSGVGPDRIRAKRELADCLWAIQALTGRRSDQRDALRAYREYLLNAPAGGADRRTVSRAKQLQDALSESN
jgi:Putative zinc-finger